MPKIFEIIKLISIIQFSLIILILILSYAVKIYFYYKDRYYQNIKIQTNKILTGWCEKPALGETDLPRLFERNPVILMDSILFLDTSIKSAQWKRVRTKVIDAIILPNARVYAKSSLWSRRYIACQFFTLAFKKEDEKVLGVLMEDPIPLVSVTAALLAIQIPSQDIIDHVIDIFSQSRRVQQSFYSQIMATADPGISVFIKHRIHKEKNPYIRAFCYRTLMGFPPAGEKVKTIKTDLHSNNIELKISSFVYFIYSSSKIPTEIWTTYLHDRHWEVRAKCAQLLGKNGDKSLACLLEKNLNDPEWWVRFHAAEALASLGREGINILKKQKPLDNKYAYEIATQILSAQ